ncbi:MAG: InlB B-repeat-containing protein [Clostridium sp.]|nr:InlB B-repeat-containing protein [Clostridium sp.]
MQRLIYNLLALFILLPTYVSANDILTATVTEVQPRSEWFITMVMDASAEDNYTAFQMDVTLPDGFSYADGTISPGTSIPTHAIAASPHPDGFLRIVAYSATNQPVGTGKQVLFSLRLKADAATVAAGTYSIRFDNILFSMRSGKAEQLEYLTARLTCSQPKQKFHLIYMVEDEVYSDVELEEGAPITHPEAPVREGHTFEGWEGLPATMPASDVTVTARFSVNSYTVTYYLDNKVYTTQSVPFGSPVVPPAVEAPKGYVFDGWMDVPETMPAKDVSIHGNLSRINSITTAGAATPRVDVYTLQGVLIRRNAHYDSLRKELPAGIYIVNGRTVYIR